MSPPSRARLGELLVRAGVVTIEQVDAAAAVHRLNERTIGQQLLADGAVTEVELAAAVSYQLDIPFVLLASYPIDDVAALLTPGDQAARALVVSARDDHLLVAMSDPTDLPRREALAERTGRRVVPLLALASDIAREVERRGIVVVPGAAPAAPRRVAANPPAPVPASAPERATDAHEPPRPATGELVPFPRATMRAVASAPGVEETAHPETERPSAPAREVTPAAVTREPDLEPVAEPEPRPEPEPEPVRAVRAPAVPRSRGDAGPDSQIVRFFLAQAIRESASDIHVEPLADRLRIRFRVEGALREVTQLPRDMSGAVASRIRSLAGMSPDEARGRLAVRDNTKDATFDVSTVATLWGEKIVLRLMERGDTTPDLGDLGMEPGTLERWRELLRSPYGLLLVAGMPGMGKTTTLYASLRELPTQTKDVTTVEDPVAYGLDGVNQVQVDRAAGGTLASTLRSVLAQEPDIVLVGELRDKDVAETTMNAALAGRLALSSIQAADALGALYRIVTLGADPYLVSASVVAVLAQLLVPRLCEHCRTATQPAMIEAALLRQAGLPSERVHVARGCARCNGTGRRGRVAAFELLIPTEELRSAIERGAKVEEAREIASRGGILTLREAGLRLVSEGLTTMQEVMTRMPATGS